MAASLNVLCNAMDLVEETRENIVVGSPQASALGTPAAPMVSERAIAPMDAQLKALQTDYCDEESGRSRWSRRHLTRVRSDNPSRHCGWDDCAAMIAEGTMHEQARPESSIGAVSAGQLDTRAVMLIFGRNVSTAGSPAYGGHCNANARLEFPLRGDLSISVSSCMLVFDSVPFRTWSLFLARLVVDEISKKYRQIARSHQEENTMQ